MLVALAGHAGIAVRLEIAALQRRWDGMRGSFAIGIIDFHLLATRNDGKLSLVSVLRIP